MRLVSIFVLALGACIPAYGSDQAHQQPKASPVLVELFTSEGCSSCPPADRLLAELDAQPISGADTIVLSEHVDYWNNLGWKDPFSAAVYSRRQGAYGRRFSLDGVYTPQMVVDGSVEFVGSDSKVAREAVRNAASTTKVPLTISVVGIAKELTLRIDSGPLQGGSHEAEVYVGIAADRVASAVSAGENAGHTLTHTAVLQWLEKAGDLSAGRRFSRELRVPLDARAERGNLRVVVFLQEPGQGRILGAAAQRIHATP